ncbi:hypothetical protein [Paenibacillus sp. GbtcB18]|uniref:hypothetical protein n=1 Tax=Paenibacillus sp. GbtcB18 TaxID=2824763 RepID=UPI001C308B7F|nr:hypothetical protein [Paenibacillus sp. GbtcB18]
MDNVLYKNLFTFFTVIVLFLYMSSKQKRYLIPAHLDIFLFSYKPTITAVSKIQEFFQLNSFGKVLEDVATKTSIQYQGQSVYRVTKKIHHDYINKKDGFYLDGLHKNHLEVVDKFGYVKVVLNLDGSINFDKTEKALKENRFIGKGW